MQKKHVKHVEKLNTDRISFLDAPRRWKVEFSLKKKVVPFDLSQCLLNHRNQEQLQYPTNQYHRGKGNINRRIGDTIIQSKSNTKGAQNTRVFRT